MRTPARPWPPVAAGLGSADAADTLAGLSWLLVVGDLLPVVGRGRTRCHAARRLGVLSAWRLALCGAPGALQVVSGA